MIKSTVYVNSNEVWSATSKFIKIIPKVLQTDVITNLFVNFMTHKGQVILSLSLFALLPLTIHLLHINNRRICVKHNSKHQNF